MEFNFIKKEQIKRISRKYNWELIFKEIESVDSKQCLQVSEFGDKKKESFAQALRYELKHRKLNDQYRVMIRADTVIVSKVEN
uniref:Uncharacterized protein n=1 Tax=viral metagenome TaxID=1070528 RepID=A0A6H1ZS80_9ZZZZ